MALPTTFSNRVRLQAGRVPERQGTPSPVGQVATILGRTMGVVGEQRHEVDQQIAASQARIQEREIARDREVQDVELREKLINMQLDRTTQARGIEENYAVGDDVPAAIGKLYEDSDAAFIDGITDQELRGKYRVLVADDRARALERADIFMRQKRAERETNSTIGITTALQNKMVTLGPEGSLKDFDEAEATLKGIITPSRFGTRAEVIQRDLLSKVADSWLDGRLIAGDHKGATDAITSGRFAAFLDPATAATALAKVQQRMQAAQTAQVGEFKETARTTLEDVRAGVDVDPKRLEAMAAQADAAGEKDLAHDLRNGLGAIKANVFRDAPPAQIVAARREIEQTPEWRKRPDVVAAWTQLGELERKNRDRVKHDVLGIWAAATNRTVPPLDLSDPASIRARDQAGGAAQSMFGGPKQVMSADEVEPLRRQFETGSAADRAAIIANFASGGGDTGKAFMRQIAPAKPEYAWLSDLAGMRNTTVGRGYVREALNGWELLKSDTTVVSGENGTKMRDAFDRLLGRSISSDQGPARQGIMEVARGIYGARAHQNGVRDYDAKLWEASVKDAIGASVDGTGGIGRTRNSAAMILPRGASQSDVDRTMARASGPNIVAAAGGDMPMWGQNRLKVGQLLDMQMEWAGDGYYRFRNASGKYVSASSNPKQPFILNIRRLETLNQNAPAPAVAPAARPAPALQSTGSSAARAALGGASPLEMLGIRAPNKAQVKRDAADLLGGKK